MIAVGKVTSVASWPHHRLIKLNIFPSCTKQLLLCIEEQFDKLMHFRSRFKLLVLQNISISMSTTNKTVKSDFSLCSSSSTDECCLPQLRDYQKNTVL